MFHASEISRKILSSLNRIPPSPERAQALACAVPKRCPAAAPATQTGMLVEPEVVPAAAERSRAAGRPGVPAGAVTKPAGDGGREEASLVLGYWPPVL